MVLNLFKHSKKLNIVFPKLKSKERKKINHYGVGKITNLPMFVRKELDEFDEYVDCLSSVKDFIIRYSVTDLNLLTPHIHTADQSMVNFYIDADDEVTTFWHGELERDNRLTKDNGNTYYAVRCDRDIYPVDRFIAKPQEAWALDTLTAHSVLPNLESEKIIVDKKYKGNPLIRNKDLFEHTKKMKRKVIQFSFDIPFAELIDRLDG